MGILELPDVHMHWADRWGLRGSNASPSIYVGSSTDMPMPIVLDVPTYDEEPSATWPGSTADIVYTSEPEPEPLQPWFTVRCGVCDHEIPFYIDAKVGDLNPFNVTVIATQCEQCASRWAAILPPVRILEADKLNLQEADIINGSTH